MSTPNHLAWLKAARRILADAAGIQPGTIDIIIIYHDSGYGIEFHLPPTDPDHLWPEEIVSMPMELKDIHRRLLEVLSAEECRTYKQIARMSGYAEGSHVRTALAELVRHGLAVHTPDGYRAASCQ